MAKLVGAFATSHVLGGRAAAGPAGERVFAGMSDIGRRIQALRPDVLVVISTDHMANFAMDMQAPFALGGSDTYRSLGDMDLPRLDMRGHRAFAQEFARFGAERGFDIALAEGIRPDHGIVIPRLLADPKGAAAVVLLYINANMIPAPQPLRCWNLGRTLRDYVAARSAEERIVVLATGGLSHWIFLPEMGRVNEAFDRQCLQSLAAGGGASLAALAAEDILREAGNGGLELLNWICMAGAASANAGEVVFYEPIPAWATGMGGVELHV